MDESQAEVDKAMAEFEKVDRVVIAGILVSALLCAVIVAILVL